MSVCCIASITTSVQGQGQAAARYQAITLEVTIVELTETQPDEIEKIERDSEELRRLMSESKAKIVARLRVRTRLGDNFSARVGQQGPIQTSVLPTFQTTEQMRRNPREPMQPQAATVGFPQIVYENTGLNVEGNASPAGDGKLDIRLKIEISAFDQSTGKLTPTITHRTLTEVVRLKEGETAMAMGLIQQEPPWSSAAPGASGPATLSRSSFVILLTAKPIQ